MAERQRPDRLASGPTSRAFEETIEEYESRISRDRLLGLIGLIVGGGVLIVNFIMEFDADLRLLPGGHSEAYFGASLVVVAIAAWIRFDLGVKRSQRR